MTDNVAAQGEHDPRIVHVASELVVDLGPQAENEGNVEFVTDVIAAVDYANEQCGLTYEQGRADERHRLICGEDVMPSDCACLAEGYAKGRAEVVTVNLEGDFNYVKGYNDGLVEGDAKRRREGKRIGQERVLIAWKEAEPLHDAEVRADEREKAIERVEAWLDRDEWGEAEFVRSAVIDALRGESNG